MLYYVLSKLDSGIYTNQLLAAVSDKEFGLFIFGSYFIANEYFYIVTLMLLGGLGYRLSSGVVNCCDYVFIVILFTRHWFHNVQCLNLEWLSNGDW